ncbi:carboxypeptidase regulatory-like domain-containing protein [Larkinella soli]|uniref:carboxypeptidase regulatory-like domain-containing protein n=1 Tax=Larkinella soli TaxID=1770527 RepID=UPI0013E2EF41|nr:carboxypeptidase regulatory-like domain-containing protein [Larkinella soli]
MGLCRAQTDTLLLQADRQLRLKAYARAIELYTQALSGSLPADQQMPALADRAYAYKMSGNLQQAEQAYRELLSKHEPGAGRPEVYLNFSQTLAANGKYQEAQSIHEKYDRLKKEASGRNPAPPTAQPVPGARKPPVRYRLEVLALNTSNAEFSPQYYRDGLVFVSGKKGSATLETSGRGGGSGYLDLYYVEDRHQLKISRVIRPDGSVEKPVRERGRAAETARTGPSTRLSPNDTRTVGNYGGSVSISGSLWAGTARSPQPFSRDLNTRYHEGPAAFFSDGYRIIFTRNNYDGRRVRQSAEGVTNLKLYTAVQQNGGWTDIRELPLNSNDYSVGHPALSRDDRLLFFASDMPGGFGGTDLYVSRFENGTWSKAANLGSRINTKGNELFPFIDENGSLYFASDGRGGLGGLDIYFAPLINGLATGSVEHLDAPINSGQDDFAIITDGSRTGGYFSTNRQAGNDDLFRFVRESALSGCRNLTVRIYDDHSKLPLDSVVVDVRARGEGRKDRTIITRTDGQAQLCLEISNDFTFRASKDGYTTATVGFSTTLLTDDRPTRLEIALRPPPKVIDTVQAESAPVDDGWGMIDSRKSRIRGTVLSERDRRPIEGVTVKLKNDCDGASQEVITGSDGRYDFELTEGCDYTLSAYKDRYGTNTNRIRKLSRKSSARVLSADLKMLRVGDIVRLDNIYHDLDQWTIRPDAYRELDRLVATLQKYLSLTVEIRSHTDSRGDAAYNRYLSARRANSVVSYLASKGISRKRMIAAGYGESLLTNNCADNVNCTEAEHQRNRRTEFKVLTIR